MEQSTIAAKYLPPKSLDASTLDH